MEIKETNADVGAGTFMKRAETFFANPRTLVAITMNFLVLALTTKETAFFIFDLLLVMLFAYRATGAVIAELKRTN